MNLFISTSNLTFFPHHSQNQEIKFIRKSSHYTLIVETLYHRGFDGTLFRHLESDESKIAMQEVHKGIFGAHSSGFTLAKNILRMGYFWTTREKYYIDFVRAYKKCQIHGNLVHAPA